MQRFVNLSLLPTSPRVGFTVSSSASSAATHIVSSCRQHPHTGSRPAVRPYQIVSSCRLVQIGSRPAVGQLRPNAKCKLEIGQQCGHHQSIERRRVAPLVVRMQRFVNLSLLPTSPRVGFTYSDATSLRAAVWHAILGPQPLRPNAHWMSASSCGHNISSAVAA